jgi:hypothetical protein
MLMANASALQAAASFTRFKDQSVDSTIESSSPGLPAPSSGVVSNPPGDGSVVGLLLICLFAAALLTPFGASTPPEQGGKRSLLSISTASPKRRRTGGTEKEPYDTV